MRKFKPMKVFLDGVRLRDVYPHATKLEVAKYRIAKFMRKAVRLAIFSLIVSGITIGVFMYYFPNKEVVQQIIVESKAEYPVLDRIVMCESGNKHFRTDGQVNLNVNKDQTVDIGVAQINEYFWGKKATSLGFDLTKEQDNRDMALWIYKNVGTGPWSASSKCWSK